MISAVLDKTSSKSSNSMFSKEIKWIKLVFQSDLIYWSDSLRCFPNWNGPWVSPTAEFPSQMSDTYTFLFYPTQLFSNSDIHMFITPYVLCSVKCVANLRQWLKWMMKFVHVNYREITLLDKTIVLIRPPWTPVVLKNMTEKE